MPSKSIYQALCYSTILFCMLLVCGCNKAEQNNYPVLSSISIIDHNGFSETISSQERLAKFQNVDFLRSQPYQKVMRIYSRDKFGDIRAYVTSYHPNGQTKQYLEVINNRAHGVYREWHENGTLKIEAFVIGGTADVDISAEKTWLFDKCSFAWNEEGCLVAEIPYSNGVLEGDSLYYHPQGSLWKKIPYHKNQIHGTQEIYLNSGSILQSTDYVDGQKTSSYRYWPDGSIAAEESYCEGKLTDGSYFSICGERVATIKCGHGFRAQFGQACLNELQEYHNGVQDGEVKEFGRKGVLARIYHMKNDLKNGEEIFYYDPIETNGENSPMLSINWVDGKIHGSVKTWYPNGIQESRREMSNNIKNGLLTAWYTDGSTMLIEEYDQDTLVKGEYFVRGEAYPLSTVYAGRGTATIYDKEGNFMRKIQYANGWPTE